MAPRISVLMPTHNRADVVGYAIQSVLSQTEPDFELLVVADGCTDDTAEVVEAFGDSRIRLFDLPKAPFYGYANRNIALREARGDLIAFVPHDDLLFSDHLERLSRAMESSSAEWMYSQPLWVSTDGLIVPYCTNLLLDDELNAFLTVGNTIPAVCVIHTRSCLDRYGYWPEDVPSAADWAYWIRIIEGGQRARLGYLPVPTCLHFSATWKQSRSSAVSEVREWLEIADAAPWWPHVLRCRVGDQQPEQASVWAAMQAAPQWSAAVRDAVRTVIDRVAWDGIRAVRAERRALQQEVSELRGAYARAEADTHDRLAQAAAEHARLVAAFDGTRRALDETITDRDRVRAMYAAVQTEHEDIGRRLERALAERATAEDTAQALNVALSDTRGTVAALRASTSWKITAPLRFLRRLVG